MYQDLNSFKVTAEQRGRSSFVVQLWWVLQPILLGLSPQICFGWRRFILRLFGANIGKGVLIRPSVRITYPWKIVIGDYSWIGDNTELYSLGEIHIGRHVVISQRSYLCTGTHDYQNSNFALITKPIVIEDQAWVATDVFVAPGVTIGEGAVVAARSTVTKSLKGGIIYRGNPAKAVRDRL
ncbi:MAG: colanic acid biosynthesis acetyltransferase WcaF [Pseudomonadales bacterium]|nr:colanic acid biosynthesis acetyltransferase WcaF [Pseudomonadales bacterium]